MQCYQMPACQHVDQILNIQSPKQAKFEFNLFLNHLYQLLACRHVGMLALSSNTKHHTPKNSQDVEFNKKTTN